MNKRRELVMYQDCYYGEDRFRLHLEESKHEDGVVVRTQINEENPTNLLKAPQLLDLSHSLSHPHLNWCVYLRHLILVLQPENYINRKEDSLFRASKDYLKLMIDVVLAEELLFFGGWFSTDELKRNLGGIKEIHAYLVSHRELVFFIGRNEKGRLYLAFTKRAKLIDYISKEELKLIWDTYLGELKNHHRSHKTDDFLEKLQRVTLDELLWQGVIPEKYRNQKTRLYNQATSWAYKPEDWVMSMPEFIFLTSLTCQWPYEVLRLEAQAYDL